jgi:hypothetical protein
LSLSGEIGRVCDCWYGCPRNWYPLAIIVQCVLDAVDIHLHLVPCVWYVYIVCSFGDLTSAEYVMVCLLYEGGGSGESGIYTGGMVRQEHSIFTTIES